MTRNDALADAFAELIANRNTGNSARWNKMIAAWAGRNADAIIAALSPAGTNASETGDAALAEWDDPSVQLVYQLLVDPDEYPPNSEEHWEGWVARRIVAALSPPASETGDAVERACGNGWPCRLVEQRDKFIVAEGLWDKFTSTLPAAIAATPAADNAEQPEGVERAIKALDLAEQISGRHEAGDAPTSLTPHGWEYIFSAFDAARAALAASSPGETELLRDLRKFVTEAHEEGMNGFWCKALTDRIDATLNGRPG